MRGKATIEKFANTPDQDHPRLCGEKFQQNHHSPCYKGSPPPMRGKAPAADWTELSIRITPAYAGKRTTNFFNTMTD